jgi:hypothetical protein
METRLFGGEGGVRRMAGNVYPVPHKYYFGYKFEYDPENKMTETTRR